MKHTTVIGYLGPAGSFSEEAALLTSPAHVRRVALPSLPAVFDALQSGKIDQAIVPVENVIEGTVRSTLTHLLQSRAHIVAEVVLPVTHYLLSTQTTPVGIRVVYSHPQALAQCAPWLQRHLPRVRLEPKASTSLAAQSVTRKKHAAAIASLRVAYLAGLNIIAADIAAEANNATRFYVLVNKRPAERSADTTALYCVVPDRPGSLVRLLQLFAQEHLNVIRLEARPLAQAKWEYGFFLDVAADLAATRYRPLLRRLCKTATVRVLGRFRREQLRNVSSDRALQHFQHEFLLQKKIVRTWLQPEDTPLARLANTRLMLMPSVVLWKWQRHLPIAQPLREKNLVQRRVSLLRALGVPAVALGPHGDYQHYLQHLLQRSRDVQTAIMKLLRSGKLPNQQLVAYDGDALRCRLEILDTLFDRTLAALSVRQRRSALRHLLNNQSHE